MSDISFVLASKSPRRRELFKLITDNFISEESSVDESTVTVTEPSRLCSCLAKLKCLDVYERFCDRTVIGSDTVVSIDGLILGKPVSREDAYSILRRLSGRTHTVYTGVYIKSPSFEEGFFCATEVAFNELSDAEIYSYIDTGDPFDKAGAYGIQNKAACFARSINGDYYNIMGLPVSKLYTVLKNHGLLRVL